MVSLSLNASIVSPSATLVKSGLNSVYFRGALACLVVDFSLLC
jgi:hypothetical protein